MMRSAKYAGGLQKREVTHITLWLINLMSILIIFVKNQSLLKQQEALVKPLFENTYINELHTRSIQLSGDTEQE